MRTAAASRRPREIECPATIVVGRHDQMAMAKDARAIAAALATSPVMLVAGHALMSEAPDALLVALRRAIGA